LRFAFCEKPSLISPKRQKRPTNKRNFHPLRYNL
jgi:hypothetical protein